MRSSLHLSTALTAVGLLTTLAQSATVTYVGPDCGDWNEELNWDTGSLPTLADDVVILAFDRVCLTSYGSVQGYANSVSVGAGAQIQIINNTLEIDGGSNSTVASANGILLDHSIATLHLTGSQTFSGAGSIQLDDTSALIKIANGVTVTTQLQVHGFGIISGPASGSGTLFNQHSVVSDVSTATLELAANLVLDDQDGTPDSLWKAEGSGAKLKFLRDATLDGDVSLFNGGKLDFQATVGFTHANSVFNWDSGNLILALNKKFTYSTFVSAICTNPDQDGSPCDSGDPPYEVCGANIGYSVTCP